MILELDAGNTFIKWRVINEEGEVVTRGRTLTAQLSDYAGWPAEDIRYVRAASVAGAAVNAKLAEVVLAQYGRTVAFAATQAAQAGVSNSYAQPSRMGVDRWLVMLAAWRRCERSCCIVDCGSAITVEFLEGDGQHRGGYIMPGLRLLKSSLLSNTAEILVDQTVEGFVTEPGCNTSAAVGQGVNLMFAALQEKLLRELPDDMPLFVTGGDGELFWGLAGRGEYCPELVMDGLRHALPLTVE